MENSEINKLQLNNRSDICIRLIDSLEKLDEKLMGFGLYAIKEYEAINNPQPLRGFQEWPLALRPTLKALGCVIYCEKPKSGSFAFVLNDVYYFELEIIRISLIKVRKFGSKYLIDNRQKFLERWDDLKLNKKIKRIGKASSSNFISDCYSEHYRILLFIGFDSKSNPFEDHLLMLENVTKWFRHDVEYFTRFWLDKYDRNFGIRLCAWFSKVQSTIVE